MIGGVVVDRGTLFRSMAKLAAALTTLVTILMDAADEEEMLTAHGASDPQCALSEAQRSSIQASMVLAGANVTCPYSIESLMRGK